MEPTQNISLRVPVSLLARIDVQAHEDCRTRTQQVVWLLNRAIEYAAAINRAEGGNDE
jgi:hypothetical protein